MLRSLGAPELLVILLLCLVLFGAKRLPEMGRSLGRGLREFKEGTKSLVDDVNKGANEQAAPASSVNGAAAPTAEPATAAEDKTGSA